MSDDCRFFAVEVARFRCEVHRGRGYGRGVGETVAVAFIGVRDAWVGAAVRKSRRLGSRWKLEWWGKCGFALGVRAC